MDHVIGRVARGGVSVLARGGVSVRVRGRGSAIAWVWEGADRVRPGGTVRIILSSCAETGISWRGRAVGRIASIGIDGSGEGRLLYRLGPRKLPRRTNCSLGFSHSTIKTK